MVEPQEGEPGCVCVGGLLLMTIRSAFQLNQEQTSAVLGGCHAGAYSLQKLEHHFSQGLWSK